MKRLIFASILAISCLGATHTFAADSIGAKNTPAPSNNVRVNVSGVDQDYKFKFDALMSSDGGMIIGDGVSEMRLSVKTIEKGSYSVDYDYSRHVLVGEKPTQNAVTHGVRGLVILKSGKAAKVLDGAVFQLNITLSDDSDK